LTCPALRLSCGRGTRAGLLNRAVDFVTLANALHLAAPGWVADPRIVTALRKRTGQRRGGPHGRRWTGARGTNGRHFVRQCAPRTHFAVATAANAAGIGCFGNKAEKRHTQSEQNQSASSAKNLACANGYVVCDGHFGQPANSPLRPSAQSNTSVNSYRKSFIDGKIPRIDSLRLYAGTLISMHLVDL
jgi:hypothetical protein